MRVNAVCLFLSIPSFCPCCMPWPLCAKLMTSSCCFCWGHSGSWAGGRKKSEVGRLCGCLFPLLLTPGPQPPASLWIFRVIAAPTPLATENCTAPWDFTQRITVSGFLFLFVCLRISRVAQVGPSQLRVTLRSHSSCIYLPSAWISEVWATSLAKILLNSLQLTQFEAIIWCLLSCGSYRFLGGWDPPRAISSSKPQSPGRNHSRAENLITAVSFLLDCRFPF